MSKENKERGEASILIELKNGKILVYHGTDKVLLFEKEATGKSWDGIWEAIKNS